MKKHYGSAILAFFAVMPLLFWIDFVGIDSVTKSFGTMVASSGKAAALSGIALYSLMPLLSMRHRAVTGLFGGIDKAYRLHSQAGKISFYLIVLHPILLGLGRYINGSKFSQLWDWWSILIISGLIGLSVLIFVTIVTIFSHIKHQNWIWIHRFYGWGIPLFFIHALVAKSQIVQNKTLLVYMLFLGTIGFCAFLYRSVLSKYFIVKHRYQVSEINRFTDKVVEVVLKPLGIPMSFTPGQFAFLSFDSDEIDREAHPFSFSNANNGPYVRFTIKELGDDTANLKKLKPGTKAFLEGPYGNFSYKNVPNSKQVWIAGGIGITPFLSMSRSFSGKKSYDIRFFYATESLDEAVFLQEFLDITRHLPNNFRATVVSKDKSGFVTAKLLKSSLGDLNDFDYMICGPPMMMQSIEEQLKQAGVPSHKIHVESFSM